MKHRPEDPQQQKYQKYENASFNHAWNAQCVASTSALCVKEPCNVKMRRVMYV